MFFFLNFILPFAVSALILVKKTTRFPTINLTIASQFETLQHAELRVDYN